MPATAATPVKLDDETLHDVSLEAAQAARDATRDKDMSPAAAAKAVVDAYLAARRQLLAAC